MGEGGLAYCWVHVEEGQDWHVRSIPEQEDHDQGVRKANFASVDGAIAGAFHHGEDIMVAGVEDDAFDGSLCACGYSQSAS